jgi:tetratricopeptide (TPR) repeat protein
MRDLAAAARIQEGRLDSVSDFHQLVRDRASAADAATQKVVRTKEQLDAQYEELKAILDADPENPIKMQNLAECQWRRGNIEEAMSLLKKALAQSGEYRFKARMDDIRMAESRAALRKVVAQLEAEPDRTDLKAKQQQLIKERDASELEIFTERQKQYPTDLGIRYELGVRQYRMGQIDEAIVSFQQATREPKRRIRAYNMLGRCFFAKKLYEEAQGQFEAAIQQYELTGDPLGKELRYNLALSLEAQRKHKEAVEWYSDIVQQDYQYRDAAKRLEQLRQRAGGEAAET